MTQLGSKGSSPGDVLRRPPGVLLMGTVLLLLSGCNTLDPTGEWRGLERSASASVSTQASAVQSERQTAAQALAVPPDRQSAPVLATVNAPGPSVPSAGLASRAGQDLVSTTTAVRSVESAVPEARDHTAVPLERLIGQAEHHYRNRRQREAEQAFRDVIRTDPLALHAWFRLGNLSHARGDLDGAAQAYRTAIELKPRHSVEREAREKSLANLAIIGLEQARVALERLGDRTNSSDARERAGTLAPVLEQRQAALQEEMARLAPRPPILPRVDTLGLALSASSLPTDRTPSAADRLGRVVDLPTGPQNTSIPRVRVESYLPDDSVARATDPSRRLVPGERVR